MPSKFFYRCLLCFFFFLFTALTEPQKVFALTVTPLSGYTPLSTVKVFEKYEYRFTLDTTSQYPFFQYDANPPSGVTPGIGVTVEGIITGPSGEKKQPAFYMTEVVRSGSGAGMRFEETNKKYWVLRFSPQETGTFQVKIHAKDASGETTFTAGSFTATEPTRQGFVKVSDQDNRYFEFSNNDIFWPIGPAWSKNHSTNSASKSFDYSQYKNTGQNLERFWMIGIGVYTSVATVWSSTAEEYGNEGKKPHLSYDEHYPGHELSYKFDYPDGYLTWLPSWEDELFSARLKAGTKYQAKLVIKTVGLTGSASNSGFIIKAHYPDIMYENPSMSRFLSYMNSANTSPQPQTIINHQTGTNDWKTITNNFTANQNWTDFYLYLDNITAGKAYVDEFSIKECLTADCSSLGGEIIRTPRADQHTYVEQRPAAFIDWQLEQGEANGVFFQYVVHDKNDWIQGSLDTNGNWIPFSEGTRYYAPENTKSRWLLRQWYRYLIARWGYSTAIYGWELNNEGPPGCCATSNDLDHFYTAQAFAKFMHENDSHPHLASTSFWSPEWRPAFWGDKTNFPDVNYADFHEYPNSAGEEYTAIGEYCYFFSSKPSFCYDSNGNYIPPRLTPYDEVAWSLYTGKMVCPSDSSKRVGKPVVRGETGIENATGPMPDLTNNNPGVYYHNMLWVQLQPNVFFDPNYWWAEHLSKIDRESISKPFWYFVKSLDLNQGGYIDAAASATSSYVQPVGQKNLTKKEAVLWIRHKNYLWKNFLDNPNGDYSLSGNVVLKLNPSTSYKVEWWNTQTYSASALKTETLSSNSSGDLTLSLAGFSKDVAVKISSSGSTPTCPTGDLDGNCQITVNDIKFLLPLWNTSSNDLTGDGKVNSFDFSFLILKI